MGLFHDLLYDKSMSANFAKGITWDLSDLYASIQDAKIESDLKVAEEKARAFEKKYKPLF